MAVAYDAVATGSGAAVTSLSWTHTPVGTPTVVTVLGFFYNNGSGTFSVTYGGTSMGSAAISAVSPHNTSADDRIYALTSPSSGAQTVSISQSGNSMYLDCASITVTGSVTSGSVFSNTNSNAATSSTPSGTVTSATGELVVDLVDSAASSTYTATGSNQTLRWQGASIGTGEDGGSTTTGAASVTVSYTNSAGSQKWQILLGSIKAASLTDVLYSQIVC